MTPKRLHILVSAYACEPGRGSEPGVGWNWVVEASKLHDLSVITRANNRGAIESASGEPLRNVRWIYYDLPRWARFWKRGQRGVHLYYYLWQIGAYLVARRLHRRRPFDLAHHVTFVNYWMPSFMALLPCPFIWGPVGGGETTPGVLRKGLPWRGRVYEAARDTARWLGEHDPFVRFAAKNAAAVLATTEETAARLRRMGTKSVVVCSEAGLSMNEVAELAGTSSTRRSGLTIVSVGRLLHWKGHDLALESFASVCESLPDARYRVFGAGPERDRLEALAVDLGIRARVEFMGSRSRPEVFEALRDSDVVLHPSLHDSGGWVCLEAMAAGKPIICLDVGGPGAQVTAQTGIKVPPGPRKEVLSALGGALARLSQDAALREKMGRAGRELVEQRFAWDEKIRALQTIYERCA